MGTAAHLTAGRHSLTISGYSDNYSGISTFVMTDPSDHRSPYFTVGLEPSGLKYLVSCPSYDVAELAAAPSLDESLGISTQAR